MTQTAPDNLLSRLADRLAQSWSKLGAVVGWQDRSSLPGATYFEEKELLAELAEQSLRNGFAVTRITPQGRGLAAIPIDIIGGQTGVILCQLPCSPAEQVSGLLDVFVRHLEDVRFQFRGEDDLAVMSRELSGSYEELSLIYRLGDSFSITDDPARFLVRFATDLLELIKAKELMLLVTQRPGRAETCHQAGQSQLGPDAMRTICRYLLDKVGSLRREPVIFSGINAHPVLVRLFGRTDVAILAQPLVGNDATLGIMVAVGRESIDQFDSTHAKLFSVIAEHTGNYLQNRLLLSDVQELLAGLLASLVSAIDAKDPYTRGHSQRVAFIGQRIAESLGLTKKQCAQVYMAGLLHDIGKIGISDKVLAKPGKLTEEEFATIQEHPVIGSRIISSVRPLRSILPAVLHHHERYDGKGYCEGLAGQQIPLMGMIVGLADAFDAITSARTYRKAMTFKDAVNEVIRCSGNQFSPDVVKGLLDCDLPRLEKELRDLAEQNISLPILPNLNWIE